MANGIMDIAGYKINGLIHKGANTVIYRATEQSESRSAVLKILRPEKATIDNLLRLKQEYEINQNLKGIPGITRISDFKKLPDSAMIVFEDFQALPLAEHLKNRLHFTIPEIITIAIRLTEILGSVHRSDVIHRSINPFNILWNPATQKLKLIDFGFAVHTAGNSSGWRTPVSAENHFRYISPEQTGRTNRTTDYRTDYYSLGITLYELLTGSAPFVSDDPLELMHSHIARAAKLVHEVSDDVFPALSKIVMKLISKNATDRYQSAEGLIYDLKLCEKQASRNSFNDFEPGLKDHSQNLILSQKVYGREKEIKSLLMSVDQILQGQNAAVFISGSAGVGKTTLVQSVPEKSGKSNIMMVSGKYDQYKVQTPYAGIAEAFSRLIYDLCLKPEHELLKIQNTVKEALGSNGRVIADIIPEIELLTGPLPPLEELDSAGAENRLKYTFHNFIRSISSKDRPVILFLDDLQWIDEASLMLLKSIVEDYQIRYFMLIGAFRNREAGQNKELAAWLKDSLQKTLFIELLPLEPADFQAIFSESFENQDTGPLARICYGKTDGNPFFLRYFMTNLLANGLIQHDGNHWTWDIQKIEDKEVTGNVVELLTGKISFLPDVTKQYLRTASVLGTRFSLNHLAIAMQTDTHHCLNHLYPAIQEQFIFPVGDLYKHSYSFKSDLEYERLEFKFSHDQIQQAVYSGIDPGQINSIQVNAGRRLSRMLRDKEKSDNIYFILNLYNADISLISNQEEKEELIVQNTEAGRRALLSGAYEQSLLLLSKAAALQEPDHWQANYERSFELYRHYAQSLYLNHKIKEAIETIRSAVSQCKTGYDQAVYYRLLLTFYTMEAEYEKAKEIAFSALGLLKAGIENTYTEESYNLENGKLTQYLAGSSIAGLAELPEVSEPEKELSISILSKMLPVLYFTDQKLYPLIILKTINLAAKYGNSAEMATVYSSYGLILAGVLHDYSKAYEFGLLSLEVARLYNSKSEECRALQLFVNHMYIWKKEATGAKEINRSCFQTGLESGEIQFAGYSCNNDILNRSFSGEPLFTILTDIQKYTEFTDRTGNLIAGDTIRSVETVIHIMQQPPVPGMPAPEDVDNELIRNWKERNSFYALCSYYAHMARFYYLAGAYEKADECIQESKKFVHYMPGSIVHVLICFFEAVTRIALCGETNQQPDISQCRSRLKNWSENCPENFEHLYYALEAEMARLDRNYWKALEYYDRAVDAAKTSEFIFFTALYYEMAGNFLFEAGKTRIAAGYLEEAFTGYKAWGAVYKSKQLSEKYKNLFHAHIKDDSSNAAIPDLQVLGKATRAISGETTLNGLIEALLHIMLQTSGAQKGIVTLCKTSGLHEEPVCYETMDGYESGRYTTSVTAVSRPVALMQESNENQPASLIRQVHRTGKIIQTDNVKDDKRLNKDRYVILNRPASILCIPVTRLDEVIAVIYLENRLSTGATPLRHIEILKILAGQTAVSLHNAILHENQEKLILARTREIHEENKKLEKITITDSLTGVYNRIYILNKLTNEVSIAGRYNRPLCISMADADHFKSINDNYGHQTGDEVLKLIAQTMQDRLSDSGFIGRYGGEEFLLIFPNTDLNKTIQILESIRTEVENIRPAGRLNTMTVSCGVAMLKSADTPESLLKRADEQLYRAKKNGRNRIESE